MEQRDMLVKVLKKAIKIVKRLMIDIFISVKLGSDHIF